MDNIKYSSAELESAHISLAELITNIKVIVDSTKIASELNKENLNTFNKMSGKFLNRESMVGYEMLELIESLKSLSTSITNNQELASTFSSSKLTKSLDSILSNTNISAKTKSTVAKNFNSQVSEFSGISVTGESIEALVNSLDSIVTEMKSDKAEERLNKIKSDDSLSMASNTESTLASFIDKENKITLEALAKNKSSELSQGSMAGRIDYVEDLFGINGATDFLSDKMGDLFGLKNIKENLIAKLGTSAKSIYSGIEEFLPEMFKLDEKRFYDLNNEIISNSNKIMDGLNNDMVKAMISHDKQMISLKDRLAKGSITLDDFNKEKEFLDSRLAEAEDKINKKRKSVQKDLDDAIASISNVDLTNATENLYMTIEQNRKDMETDLLERKHKGIISDAEIEKTMSEFQRTESALKSNLETSFKTDKNFSLEDYIDDTSRSIRNSNQEILTNSPEVTKAVNELNAKFDAFIDYNKQKDRQEQLDSDLFGESKDSENVKTEGGDNNSVEDKVNQGEDLIMDSIGSLLDMDGGNRKNRNRKNKGRPKSNGGKGGFLSKAGGLGKSLLGGAGKFGSTALAAGSSLIGGAGSALAGAMKFAGPIGLALTAGKAVYDGVDGWGKANENFDLKEGQEATTGQKASSVLGGIASGLSFGLLDSKDAAQGIHKFGGDIANLFGFGDNKNEDGSEKKFGDSWMDYTPIGLAAGGAKALGSLFGDDKKEETKSAEAVKGELISKTDSNPLSSPDQIVKDSEKVQLEQFKTEQDKQDRIIELLESMSPLSSVSLGGWFPSNSGGGNPPPKAVAAPVNLPQPSPVPVQKNIDDLGVMIINQGFFS